MFGSCLKRVDYPIVPDLEFISVFLNANVLSEADSIGFVKFSFTDGDGDLGLYPADTFGVNAPGEDYYYNLFIHYFEKQNGQYVEFVPLLPFHVRFENLTPTGADKNLEGEMNVGIFARPGTSFDTVRYEMYIVDRELHHSDTVVTPEIILPF